MAGGSLRQMRRYADKVSKKDARLARMTDGSGPSAHPVGGPCGRRGSGGWCAGRRPRNRSPICSWTGAGGRGWA